MKIVIGVMIIVLTLVIMLWPEEKIEVDEYVVEDLRLRVFFGRAGRSAMANFDDFDKWGRIYLSCFVPELPRNEVERQIEGKMTMAGRAIVRCKKGTHDVVSWTYLK